MYNNSNSVFATAGKIVAFIIGLFILGNVVGLLSNIKHVNNIQTVNIQTTESTTIYTEPSTSETTTETTTAESTTAPTTTAPTTIAVTTTEDIIPDSKEEIVAIFNKSANNVKKNAKVVTRNYENLIYDRAKSDYPAVLLAVARPLIPFLATIPATIVANAAVGPAICTVLPPRAEITKPAIIAV